MAPGANYMGGKRNAARARSKDTTRRTHKAHFGRQRLDILTKGLLGRNTTSNAFGPRATASDIELSHAKQSENDSDAFIPGPHRPMKAGQSSEKRRSRVLEALHTAEPLAMRAAMDQILSIPDLAGLSTRRTPELKRPRFVGDSDSPCPRRKRHKEQEARSSSLSPGADDVELESMDMVEGCNSPSQIVDEKESEPPRKRLPPVRRDPQNPPILLSAAPSDASAASPELNPAGFRFRNNLYDYQDPWNAVGVILGLEESLPESFTEEELATQNLGLDDEEPEADDDDTASVYSFASNESLGSFVKRLAPEGSCPSTPVPGHELKPDYEAEYEYDEPPSPTAHHDNEPSLPAEYIAQCDAPDPMEEVELNSPSPDVQQAHSVVNSPYKPLFASDSLGDSPAHPSIQSPIGTTFAIDNSTRSRSTVNLTPPDSHIDATPTTRTDADEPTTPKPISSLFSIGSSSLPPRGPVTLFKGPVASRPHSFFPHLRAKSHPSSPPSNQRRSSPPPPKFTKFPSPLERRKLGGENMSPASRAYTIQPQPSSLFGRADRAGSDARMVRLDVVGTDDCGEPVTANDDTTTDGSSGQKFFGDLQLFSDDDQDADSDD